MLGGDQVNALVLQLKPLLVDDVAFLMGDDNRVAELIEFDETRQIFTNPADERTEAYITGRFG